MADVRWNTRFDILSPTIRHRWQGVPPGVEHKADIPYKSIDGRDLLLDLYLPEWRPEKVPAILWVSGGGWRGMDRTGAQIVSAWICARGYAVVGVEYRVESEGQFPAQIEDCKGAVRWLRAHAAEYSIDPARIGAWGDSAGGHLVELLATTPGLGELESEEPHLDQSSAVCAVCAFYPPSDMRPYAATSHRSLFRDDKRGVDEWARIASPIDHVSAETPPHLLVHGDADTVVPLEHSTKFMALLHEMGVECTLAVLPKVGHDGKILYGAEEVKALVAGFFARHLNARH